MEFLNLWFNDHYILSTVLTPTFTIAWCIWCYDQGVRLFVSFLWYAYLIFVGKLPSWDFIKKGGIGSITKIQDKKYNKKIKNNSK